MRGSKPASRQRVEKKRCVWGSVAAREDRRFARELTKPKGSAASEEVSRRDGDAQAIAVDRMVRERREVSLFRHEADIASAGVQVVELFERARRREIEVDIGSLLRNRSTS